MAGAKPGPHGKSPNSMRTRMSMTTKSFPVYCPLVRHDH